MAVAAELGSIHFDPVELVGAEHRFWPNVIDVLQTHSTSPLLDRVVEVATHAPQVNLAKVDRTLDIIMEEYDGKKRKLTGDNEVNHSLHVFLVGSELIGPANLTTRQSEIMLGHNLVEDTTLPRQVRKELDPYAFDGIDVLSHKIAGTTRCIGGDKTPHFLGIIAAHREPEHADSELVPIKVADLIVVTNDPLTAGELSDPSKEAKWGDMTERKLAEMRLFQRHLPPDQIGAHRRLREAIIFTRLRQDPDAHTKLNDVLRIRRNQESLRAVK